MNILRLLERLMAMDESSWARHANPLSVWTRVAALPLLIIAVWSRAWLGWWALMPVTLALLWLWLNPRAFKPPRSTDNWASKGTFGERIFLNRHAVPIPHHHVRAANILTLLSAVGAIILVYGLVVLDLGATVSGYIATSMAKLWFVDRMAWLYEDMKDVDPEYRSWLR